MSDQELPPPTPPNQPSQPPQVGPEVAAPPAAPPPPPPPPYQPYPAAPAAGPEQWSPPGSGPAGPAGPAGPWGHPGFPPPAPPSSRGPVVAVVIAAALALVLVLTAAAGVLFLLAADEDPDSAASDGDAPATTGLEDVEVHDGLDATHLEPGAEHDYPQSPPVGGVHAPYWLDCGVYDVELPETAVVHDLEHGTVWITYRPDDVDAAGVAALGDQLPDNGILSPYAAQSAPLVITVWGRQLELTGPDDPRIAPFIAQFGAGETAPEPFASCHGGLGLDELDSVDPGGTVV